MCLVMPYLLPMNLMLVRQNARNLVFVDDVVREINIGRYQHKFEVISAQ